MPEISQEELTRLTEAAKERDTFKAAEDARKAADKTAADAKAKADADEKARKEKDEGDLDDKVKRQREEADKAKNSTKSLETALKFNMSVGQFIEGNKEVLPADIPEILKAAEKETYDSASEKASAIQTGVIKAFFSIQANVDLLTANQKTQLQDYLKLTKSGKDERAAHVYENIFEPALEVLKKVKKHEEVTKSRTTGGNKSSDDYRDRLVRGSRKHYLGEKDAK